jgi:hypothetical protein
VSFTVLEGQRLAPFPNLPGWSALDSARRAVAEHHAWLAMRRLAHPLPHTWAGPQPSSRTPTPRGLGLLLTAARAALFLQSIEAGKPELLLTLPAVARSLGDAYPRAKQAATEAVDEYLARRSDRTAPDPTLFAALRTAVLELPAYA